MHFKHQDVQCSVLYCISFAIALHYNAANQIQCSAALIPQVALRQFLRDSRFKTQISQECLRTFLSTFFYFFFIKTLLGNSSKIQDPDITGMFTFFFFIFLIVAAAIVTIRDIKRMTVRTV